MDDKHANQSPAAPDSTLAASGQQDSAATAKPGFIRRYRLPLFLAAVALCLYAGSILYFVYGKGQVA